MVARIGSSVDLLHVALATQLAVPWWVIAGLAVYGAGSIWVGVQNIKAVVRINASNDTVVATIPDQGVCREIVADDQGIWVAGGCVPGPGVTRIDPATNAVTEVSNANGNSPAIALGETRSGTRRPTILSDASMSLRTESSVDSDFRARASPPPSRTGSSGLQTRSMDSSLRSSLNKASAADNPGDPYRPGHRAA